MKGLDSVKSDDYKKVKASSRMASGANDVFRGFSALLVPDPTPVNELATVYKVAFGVVNWDLVYHDIIGETYMPGF